MTLFQRRKLRHELVNDLLRVRILPWAPGSQASVSHDASCLSEPPVDSECLKEQYKANAANSYRHMNDLAPFTWELVLALGRGETCTRNNLRGNLCPFALAPVSDLASTHDNPVPRKHHGYLAEEGEASHPGSLHSSPAGCSLLPPVRQSPCLRCPWRLLSGGGKTTWILRGNVT